MNSQVAIQYPVKDFSIGCIHLLNVEVDIDIGDTVAVFMAKSLCNHTVGYVDIGCDGCPGMACLICCDVWK